MYYYCRITCMYTTKTVLVVVHVILPYSAYFFFGPLAAHYGGPRCSSMKWWCDKKHLRYRHVRRLSM